jgi:4-carboxymuconolactone decarboxylase
MIREWVWSNRYGALDNGVRRDELIEVIMHLAFYTGWTTANAAVILARRVFEDSGG